jgi:hypothetical protein
MKRIMLAALCLGLLSGCVTPSFSVPTRIGAVPPAPPAQGFFVAQRDLLAAEAKWRQIQPADYTYTLQRACFCTPEFLKPITIEASGSRVMNVTRQPEGIPLPLDHITDALTVEGLFDVIQRAIDDKVARLDVQYDAQYGFPASISIDRNANTTDDEMYYTASGLQPVSKTIIKPKGKTKAKTAKKSSRKVGNKK